MDKWKKLVAYLREKCAYDGEDTLEGVQKWIADNEIDELTDENGATVDVKSVWDASQRPARPAADPDDNDDGDTHKRASGVKRVLRVNAAIEEEDRQRSGWTPRMQAGLMARKAYDARAKRGETRFSCADEAEVMGAYVRQLIRMNGGKSYGQEANDRAIIGKDSGLHNNLTAGVLVPVEMIEGVMYATEMYGVARKVANVSKMSRDVQEKRRKTAIPAMSHLSAGGTLSSDDNEYDKVGLTAKKVGVLCNIENELMEDAAVSVADEFASSIAEAQAYREDLDYFLGDGTSTYGGHSGLISALPAGAYFDGSGNTWGALTKDDFTKAQGLVENVQNGRMAWLCSRQFYHQVMKRLDLASNQYKELQTGPRADASFMGDPVYFSQVMPRVTAVSTKSCYYGDFMGASMLGDRRDLRVESSRDFLFDSDETVIRATARIAVNIHGDGRGSTYGPIVCIATSS